MTTAIDDALRALDDELGAGTAARVSRVEADERGLLILTLALPEATRWFAARGGELAELDPARDERLPAAGRLAAIAAAGAARIVSWRPGRRLVAALADGPFAKAYRRGRSSRAVAVHEELARALAPRGPRLPGIVGHDRAQELVMLEPLAGQPFEPTEHEPAAHLEIGRACARLQCAGTAAGLAPHVRTDELALLERLRERWAGVAGPLPTGWSEARERLSRACRGNERPCTPCHRDLHPAQILLAPDGVGLLDLDLAACAERELDVANLGVHLDLAALLAGRACSPAARAALEDGYAREGGPLDREALAWHRASTALRLALVWGLRPRGRALAVPLVALAGSSLAEPLHA